jgi:hypothetical protein
MRVVQRKLAVDDARSHRKPTHELVQLLLHVQDLTVLLHCCVKLVGPRSTPMMMVVVIGDAVSAIRRILDNSRDYQATQTIPSELTSLVINAGVDNPAACSSLRLPQLVVPKCQVRIILGDALI